MEDIESNRVEQLRTSELSCPQRCLYKLITQATFSSVLFSGLSLMTAKVFKEQVNYDEIEREEGKLYISLNLSALVGLLMIFYAIFGICLNWLNKINVKVSDYAPSNCF